MIIKTKKLGGGNFEVKINNSKKYVVEYKWEGKNASRWEVKLNERFIAVEDTKDDAIIAAKSNYAGN